MEDERTDRRKYGRKEGNYKEGMKKENEMGSKERMKGRNEGHKEERKGSNEENKE